MSAEQPGDQDDVEIRPLVMTFTDVAAKKDGTYVVTVSGARCHVTRDYNPDLFAQIKTYLAAGGEYQRYAEDIQVDTEPQLLAQIWMDEHLAKSELLVSQYRDDIDLGMATQLTQMQFVELLTWRKALRGWPQHTGYPGRASRPPMPGWLPTLITP